MTNGLLNSTIRQNPNNMIFPTIGMGKFLNNWQNNPDLVQKINISPYNQGYSNDEITNLMTQGLNFGVPEIAEAQKQWGIRTPKTDDELYRANEGIFNIYPTVQNKRVDRGMYLSDPAAKNPDKNNFLNRLKDRTKTGFSSFTDKILGTPFQGLKPANNVIDNNGNITLQTGTASGPRQGGFIRDFLSGAKENYNEGFSPNNWGEKKNWATRMGEGLGTLARFTDSVPGRALITGGLIGALGGTPTEMAAYGLNAGVGRQQNRLQNEVYRNDIINQMQNSLKNSEEFNQLTEDEFYPIKNRIYADIEFTKKTPEEQEEQLLAAYNQALTEKQTQMLADVENQVNNYKGILNSDIYKNMLQGRQLQDNADWRKANLGMQIENNKALQQYRQDNLEAQKLERAEQRADRAATRALTARGQDLSYSAQMARIQYDLEKADKAAQEKFLKDNKGNIDILNQISNIRQLINQNPRAVGLQKGYAPGFLVNRFDTKGVETRTSIDDLRTYIRHELTGAQFSPAEAREYEKFLPTTKDTPEIINKKLDALEKKFTNKMSASLKSGSNRQTVDNDPLGIL